MIRASQNQGVSRCLLLLKRRLKKRGSEMPDRPATEAKCGLVEQPHNWLTEVWYNHNAARKPETVSTPGKHSGSDVPLISLGKTRRST